MFPHVPVPDSLGAITAIDVLRIQTSDILLCHPAYSRTEEEKK